jgi:hypothetical protein
MNIHDIHQSIAVLVDLARPHASIRDLQDALRLLDPFGLYDQDPFNLDCLHTGVHAMRDCYPDTYTEFIAAWRSGTDEEVLIHLISRRIQAEFACAYSFDEEMILWGVPFQGIGIDFEWDENLD